MIHSAALLWHAAAMARYRSVKQLSVVEAAYLAGLIDGEGTVTLTALHRGERRRLVVAISSTERPILEFARAAIGAGRITRKRSYKAHHAPGFAYCIGSRQALSLLAQVTPYMKSYKAQRAWLALERYVAVTPRNGRYDGLTTLARDAFERDFLAVLPVRGAP